MISLPRSQVEMTATDQEWQDKITKVVRRVAKDLIANDETEIGEVVRRRLFEDLGSEKDPQERRQGYGDWCFERRAQLPPEWTAVDSAATEAKAREILQRRFEACYPFHPATIRCSSASGRRCRNTSRRAAPWRCWRSGSRSQPRTATRKLVPSR